MWNVTDVTNVLAVCGENGGGVPSPPVTAGLVLHLDADQIPDVEDTDPVALWPDVSGAGNDAVTGGALSPTYKAIGSNSLPAVRFASNQGLDVSTLGTLAAHTIIVVGLRDNVGLVGESPLAVNLAGSLFIMDINPGATNRWAAGATFTSPVAAVNAIPQIHIGVIDGVQGAYRVDGVMTPYVADTSTLVNLALGYRAGVQWLTGEISEVLLYDRALSEAEMEQMDQYLSTKYAIGIASPPPLPPVTTDLEAWFPADGQGHIAPAANMEVMADWSGNYRHAVQETVSAQPTLQAAVINGKPVIRFDGADDSLVTPSFVLSQPATIYLVAVINNASGDYGNIIDGNQAGGSGRLIFGPAAGDTYRMFGGSEILSGAIRNLGDQVIVTAIFDGVNSEGYLNGPSVMSGDVGVGEVVNGMLLGSNTTNSQVFTGDIAEVLVYSGLHTIQDRQAIEDWLAGIYGITITRP